MFGQSSEIIQSRKAQNDLIACNLLKRVETFEQFAIMYSTDNIVLQRILNAAIILEEYELCQVIFELMKKRESLHF